MSDNTLWNLSPLDGRYSDKISPLKKYFSEKALIKYRAKVELLWLIKLSEYIPENLALSLADKKLLQDFTENLDDNFFTEVKEKEKILNHDVKAVEVLLVEKLKSKLSDPKSVCFIHFACTSEDINNTAYALMIKDATLEYFFPLIQKLVNKLLELSQATSELPMLAKTHGQSATPTTFGKEIFIFAHRLEEQKKALEKINQKAKFNGTTGNYNAQKFCYPDLNWPEISKEFITSLGLQFNPYTTQIESHDSLVELSHRLCHMNQIAIGLCRDIWGYISLGYLVQKLAHKEVGSSVMPHKVNPIDFENAEGNFELATGLCEVFSRKLPISRFQRDLSDSTVLRNIGSLFGYEALALESLYRGLLKISPDKEKMELDLDQNWQVLCEPIQTLLRTKGVFDAYDRLKEFSRGKILDKKSIHQFIKLQDDFTADEKDRLLGLTPSNYIGFAVGLCK